MILILVPSASLPALLLYASNFSTSSQNFCIEFLKSVIDLKKSINIWHPNQDHHKTGDFRNKQEGKSCLLKTGASHSKWETPNIWRYSEGFLPFILSKFRTFKECNTSSSPSLVAFVFGIFGVYIHSWKENYLLWWTKVRAPQSKFRRTLCTL